MEEEDQMLQENEDITEGKRTRNLSLQETHTTFIQNIVRQRVSHTIYLLIYMDYNLIYSITKCCYHEQLNFYSMGRSCRHCIAPFVLTYKGHIMLMIKDVLTKNVRNIYNEPV